MRRIAIIAPAIIMIAIIALPLVSGAQLVETDKILTQGKRIIGETVIPLVFTLALLLFFWGIAKFIWQEGQGKEDGKKIMIWGVIALFVASSIWGLVKFIRDNFMISEEASVKVPTVQQ